MSRSKSSGRWLREHFSDDFVKQAQEQGYRARSAFKLLEIQKKEQIIQPGMNVADLGAAPGGWSQVALEILKGRGHIFALDILEMDPIEGVEFIQGDFCEESVLQQLLDIIGDHQVDVVLSDIAPNMSGIKVSDQARAMYLVELAHDFAKQVLKPNGSFLVKVFQGAGFDEYLKALRHDFKRVKVCKPQASRGRSKEVYLLARGFSC